MRDLRHRLDKLMPYTSADAFEDVPRQILAVRLLEKAVQQGIITEREYWWVSTRIILFGILDIPAEMAEKLAAVRWNIAEEITLPDGFYVLHTRDEQWYAWNGTGCIVFSRFSGPYSDEATARKWCQEEFKLVLAMASGEEHRQLQERIDHVHK